MIFFFDRLEKGRKIMRKTEKLIKPNEIFRWKQTNGDERFKMTTR